MPLTLPICPATPEKSLEPGIYRGLPAHDYHAMNAVSSGLVKLMASKTPLHAQHWLYSPQKPATAAMRFGTAVHAAILEPDVYAAAPTIAGLSPKALPETFARHEKENGPVVLAEGWKEQIDGIRRGAEELARDLWVPDWHCGDRELTIVWDETTASGFQVRCKARLDYYCEGWLVDIKTARSIEPEKFARDAYGLGYHIQLGGHYSRAVEAASEFEPDTVYGPDDLSVLAIENEPPHDMVVFGPTERWVSHGRKVWAETMDRLGYCLAMDDWHGVASDAGELDLPSYIEE